jgi:hypothetical protein
MGISTSWGTWVTDLGTCRRQVGVRQGHERRGEGEVRNREQLKRQVVQQSKVTAMQAVLQHAYRPTTALFARLR